MCVCVCVCVSGGEGRCFQQEKNMESLINRQNTPAAPRCSSFPGINGAVYIQNELFSIYGFIFNITLKTLGIEYVHLIVLYQMA